MHLLSLKKRLGDILVDVGIITPAQLKQALEIQKRSGGKLGSILANMGALNEEVMLAFLGKQCGVSYISLSEYGDIPENILRSVPESLVRNQMLVPISREENILTVAMADPFNVFAIDDVKLMTGLDVRVVIASESDIRSAIEKYYNTNNNGIDFSADQEQSPDSQQEMNDPLSFMLFQANDLHASEIHFEPQADFVRIRYRIDGVLYEKNSLSKEQYPSLIDEIKIRAKLPKDINPVPFFGRLIASIRNRNLDIRFSMLPTVFGTAVMIKLTDTFSLCMAIDKLGFETSAAALYKNAVEKQKGLVIIAGPIDSGKTTTVYSTLAALNRHDREIISLENPVERVIPGITQVQIPSRDLMTVLLESSLLQNPEILMLSEIYEQKTADLAARGACDGRMIFLLLGANDALDALFKLINMGVNRYTLSSSLNIVSAQRLMRVICPDCKEPYDITYEHLKNIDNFIINFTSNEKIQLWRGKGCDRCAFTGYTGRTAIYELLPMDEFLSEMIIENSSEKTVREYFTGKMVTLQESAWKKVSTGVSTIEELLRISRL